MSFDKCMYPHAIISIMIRTFSVPSDFLNLLFSQALASQGQFLSVSISNFQSSHKWSQPIYTLVFVFFSV